MIKLEHEKYKHSPSLSKIQNFPINSSQGGITMINLKQEKNRNLLF